LFDGSTRSLRRIVLIKAIIFDVGGVLVRTSDWTLRRLWEQKLGLATGQSEEMVFGEPMGTRAQLGQISTEELWHWIGQQLKLSPIELSTFQSDFWARDELDQNLVNLLDGLRGNYQMAIISNAMDNLRNLLTMQFPIADRFELIISSAEEGIMKPDTEIYRRTLNRLSVQPEEAIFIDDSPENVAGARDAGLQAVLFHTELDLYAELASRGIQIGVKNDR
jgi:epoxide hydrolase-like predicted phosphatase